MRQAGSLLVLILCCCVARASDLAMVGATVYPDADSPPIVDAVVVVRDGVIVAVGPRARTAIPSDARVIDCTGTFIAAGFWNSHVHFITPGLLEVATAAAADVERELDAMLNRWGFTTVFDIASVLENTLALRRRIDAGEVRGPRILTVGEPIWSSVPSYARDYFEANRIEMQTVTTAQEAVDRVRFLESHGANGIKLFTGSVQRGDVAHLPVDIARAAGNEAQRLRLPVFAHAQDAEGLALALEAGVDVLAHPLPDTPDWTTELVSGPNRARIALIPTLTLFEFESRRDGDPEQARQVLMDRVVAHLRAFAAGGGQVLFGTDVGYTDHFETGTELRLMARAGLDYRQVLAALTTAPARRFGFARHTGRVRRGFDADLVVLDADPAQDVANFSRVRYTIRAGEFIYRAR
jgi:imidazolonepropionase-like amidohydrolase